MKTKGKYYDEKEARESEEFNKIVQGVIDGDIK